MVLSITPSMLYVSSRPRGITAEKLAGIKLHDYVSTQVCIIIIIIIIISIILVQYSITLILQTKEESVELTPIWVPPPTSSSLQDQSSYSHPHSVPCPLPSLKAEQRLATSVVS